jgi:hypothetical protein
MAASKKELYAAMNTRAFELSGRLDPEIQQLVKALTTEQLRFSQLDTMVIFKLFRLLGIDYAKVAHLLNT